MARQKLAALQRGVVAVATLPAAPPPAKVAKAAKPRKQRAPAKPRQAQPAAQPQAQDREPGVLATTPAERRDLRASDRENAARLGGDALRELGHEWGLSRSEMAQRTDAQVRADTTALMRRKYDQLVGHGA